MPRFNRMSQPPTDLEKHDDGEACAKLWTLYTDEAENYDSSLVKSWKEDMDVTLVFVRCLLFMAS
jgi:hypothetical protein